MGKEIRPAVVEALTQDYTERVIRRDPRGKGPIKAFDVKTKEYVFDFTPGKPGFGANWKTGVVTTVAFGEQADRHGIKMGWKIVKLDDSTYSESKLNALIADSRTYSVTFSVQDVPETVTVYLPIIDENGV